MPVFCVRVARSTERAASVIPAFTQVSKGHRRAGVSRTVMPILTALGLALAPVVLSATPAAAAGNDNLIDLAGARTGGTDWTKDEKVITVLDTDGDGIAMVTVQGQAADGTRLVVAENTKAIIELNGVTIDLAGAGMRGPYHGIELLPGSTAEVQLAEGSANRLVGAYSNGVGGSGISVPADSSLVITAPGDGTGALDAIGWVAMPGIGGPGGGSKAKVGGSVTIDGGIINAFGGDSAAGIGGGYKGISGPVTINGGTVYAKGGNGVVGRNGGAGIGSGHGGVPGPITITGGTITAEGVFSGAGIGAGHQSSGVNVLITGGDVTAIGTGTAAGIGSSTMSGGSSKNTNLIVVTGESTAVNATSGRPEEADGKVAIPAIGVGDGDGTRTETFFLVGGDVVLNGQPVVPNLKLQVAEGSTGAIAVTIPDTFKNVPDSQVRLVRTLDPATDLYFSTTAAGKPIEFSTNGFDAQPGSVKAEQLSAEAVTISFQPQPVDMTLFDTGAEEPVFWAGQSPVLLGYIIVGMTALLITLVIGAMSAKSHMSRYPTR